jgi:hypothetical protein
VTTSPSREAVKPLADGRERQYVGAYRGILGFAYLILAH